MVWMASTSLLLIAATWRVWWPLPSMEFPAVPMLASLQSAPLWWSQCCTLACMTSLSGVAYTALALRSASDAAKSNLRESRGWRASYLRMAAAGVLLSGLMLIALNQHRFQPWFYQLLVFSSIWLLGGGGLFDRQTGRSVKAWWWLQAIIISVYFYSSLGKLDFQFLHTVGQQFLDAIFSLLGADVERVDWTLRLVLAALLPLSELFLAVALLYCWLWRRSRLLGWCGLAAVVFHLSLVLILGYQLQHSLGVVLWNVQFAGLALILFVGRQDDSHAVAEVDDGSAADGRGQSAVAANNEPAAADGRWWGSRLVRLCPAELGPAELGIAAISLAVIVLPLGERWGYWDHWPSWALYAPHSSRVEVLVAPPAIAKLPESLQALLAGEDAVDELGWTRLPLPSWSLEELAVPIYPQASFQLQVARELARRIDSPFQVQAIVLGPAGRFSGQRSERVLLGTDRIVSSDSR
jgi:hypothetical protein